MASDEEAESKSTVFGLQASFRWFLELFYVLSYFQPYLFIYFPSIRMQDKRRREKKITEDEDGHAGLQ